MRFSLAHAQSAEEPKKGKETEYDNRFFASVRRRLHDYVFLSKKELDELAQGNQRIEEGCERIEAKLRRMIDGASPKSIEHYRRRFGLAEAVGPKKAEASVSPPAVVRLQ